MKRTARPCSTLLAAVRLPLPTQVRRTALLSLTLLGVPLAVPAAQAQTVTPARAAPHTMATSMTVPNATRTGSFRALHAPTTGTVTLSRNAQGRWTLTVRNLNTEPAPDLRVWLLAGTTVKDTPALRQEKYTDLGEIATTVKSRTFLLPASFRPEQAGSVVLWCDQFSVVFAAATLK